jgi:hypothetical protein
MPNAINIPHDGLNTSMSKPAPIGKLAFAERRRLRVGLKKPNSFVLTYAVVGHCRSIIIMLRRRM